MISPVGLLEYDDEYRFRYLRRAEEVPGFRPFVGFADLRRVYTSSRLFPLFSKRIMSVRRPDFGEFLTQLHLSRNSTPWEQLARSGGRRAGDRVQVFPGSVGRRRRHDAVPVPRARDSPRRRRRVAGTGAGQPLVLQHDPTNPYNVDAVRVCDTDGNTLGYVPDLLLDHLGKMRATAPVRLTVEHVNGPEAPPHLRLLARLEGRVPPGYEPMSGPGWQTYS